MRLSPPRPLLLILLPFVTALSPAPTLHLTLPPTALIPNPSVLPPSTHATLTSHNQTLSAPITRANSFTFHALAPGSYLADVWSRDFAFVPMRVDVEAGGIQVWQTFRGGSWEGKGEKLTAEGAGGREVAVAVQTLAARKIWEVRGGFSPLGILMNPMILIAIVGMGLVFGMPYIMDNMDPETKAEFQEAQKSNPLTGGLTGGNSFDMAAWMAGSGSEKAETAEVSKGGGKDGGASTGASTGGKARRRG